MNITKAYWQWDEKFNPSMPRLGMDIRDFNNANFIYPDPNSPTEYNCIDENISKIHVREYKIISIFYHKKCFDFIRDNLWDMEYRKFINAVNPILKPIQPPLRGDILCVIFRGEFVTLSALLRRQT